MTDRKYIKLVDLVGDQFTVEKVWGYKYQKYDQQQGWLRSDTFIKGYDKVYNVDTDKGTVTLRAGQLSNMLEGVSRDGMADVNGQTFSVRSNGQTGKDIRYYINPVREQQRTTGRDSDSWQQAREKLQKDEDPIPLEEIPF